MTKKFFMLCIFLFLMMFATACGAILSILDDASFDRGYSILLEADTASPPPQTDMYTAVAILQGRLRLQEFYNATVTQESSRIRINIPYDLEDVYAVVADLQRVALLTFEDEMGNVLLTGAHVARAYATIQVTTIGNEPVINLEFTTEGTQLFAEATRNNIGRPIFIYMDGELLSSPIVNTVIADGSAVISGNFTNNSAFELATLIQQGAMPFGVVAIEVENLG